MSLVTKGIGRFNNEVNYIAIDAAISGVYIIIVVNIYYYYFYLESIRVSY